MHTPPPPRLVLDSLAVSRTACGDSDVRPTTGHRWIEREGEFRNYYYGTRRNSIVETWSKAVIEGEHGSSEGEPPQSLSTFYSSFLSSFLAMLNGERTTLPNIFPDPERTLSAIINTTLTVLTPPAAQRLAALFHNGSTTTAFKDVVKLYQASEEFARGAERVFEKLRISVPSLLAPPTSPNEGKHPRRRSMRMSMSWRSMSSAGRAANVGGGADEREEWDQCLFQPFLDFQADFGTLERRLLDNTLGTPLPGNIKDLDGDPAARAMRERAADVFSAAEGSIERCLAFTHGYASVGLVRTLDAFVSAFVETWTISISSLVDTDPRSTPGSKATAAAAPEDEELADLDRLHVTRLGAHTKRTGPPRRRPCSERPSRRVRDPPADIARPDIDRLSNLLAKRRVWRVHSRRDKRPGTLARASSLNSVELRAFLTGLVQAEQPISTTKSASPRRGRGC